MSVNINVWDVKEYFEKNNTFPKMSEDDKKYFLEFAKNRVDDLIETYERYTYYHGGLREEAKQMFEKIGEAEKMYKAIKEECNC